MPLSDASANLVPQLDAFGIPAPAWVFVFLMNLTLVLHFLFMGYVFTTSLLGIFWSAAPADSAAQWMLRRSERLLPVGLSFAVTLGVAPLLFVQVLYHSFFLPANILIGHQWFGIIPLMILGFYLIYLLQGGVLLGRRIPRACEVAGRVVIFGCLLYVMVTLTTNALLLLHPDRWQGARVAGSTLGLTGLPAFWPRLTHNFGAALVIGGICLMILGAISARRAGEGREAATARQLTKLGSLLALTMLLFEFATGIWLVAAESREVQVMLMTSFRPAQILWLMGLFAGVGLMIVAALGMVQPQLGWKLHAAGGVLLLVVLGGMFAAREAVRQVWLAPYFKMTDWQVNVQLSSLTLFLVIFVLALGLIGLMVWWLRQAMAAPAVGGGQES